MAAHSISASSGLLVAPSTPEPTHYGLTRAQVNCELERQYEQFVLEKQNILAMKRPVVNMEEKKAAKRLKKAKSCVTLGEVRKETDDSEEMEFIKVYDYAMWKIVETIGKNGTHSKAEDQLNFLLNWKIRGFVSKNDSKVHLASLKFLDDDDSDSDDDYDFNHELSICLNSLFPPDQWGYSNPQDI